MQVLKKTIGSVVDENFIYARALHYLGIEFFQNEHKSLIEVCIEKGLSTKQVIKCFYEFDSNKKSTFKELSSYPIDLLLEYLRHSHYLFIKEKLPYISFLIDNYQLPFANDLKTIFPVFVEDFIKHIYEEEDELFEYVFVLNKINESKFPNPATALMPYRKISLKEIREEHQGDDEMGDLREIMDLALSQDLHGRVIINELKAFDKEIFYHAEIENEILFPRAIALEQVVNAKLTDIGKLN